MPGYLLFSYKRHLYPFTNKLHHRFPFRFPLPPPYLPLYFHPPYTPSIFTTSADRWSVNRTPFHPTSRHIPPSFPFRFNFRRALLFQPFPAIIRVHFVVPSVTRLYARTSKLFPVFISIALPHCFALSFPPSSSLSLSTYVYLLHQAPLLSPPLISSRSLSIPDRYSFYLLVTFSSCFHVLHKLRSVTLPFPPVTFARF